jgi:ferredoxin-NADP reductase/ferredoxin
VRSPPADHDAVLRQHGYHRLAVKAVVDETLDTRSYVLDVPEELRETFRYRAGQFCTFRVHIDDEPQLRSYSMSSAPETDADLTVTVKRVPGGLVSNWFVDRLTAGDVLEVTRPAGVFCPRDTERPVVAFCGGSGVTPVMSITRSVLASTSRSVSIFYANRDRGSVIFDEVLRELGARHPGRLGVHHHLDDEHGLPDTDAVRRFASARAEADFYICGPTPFMDLVEDALHAMGVDEGRILIERFLTDGSRSVTASDGAADMAAAVGTENMAATDGSVAAGDGVDGGGSDHADGEDAGDGGGSDTVPTDITIILTGKTSVVAYRPGDTLLETARRGALRPPFSCEAGNCATCMALLREGSASMRANNALTPDEVAEGWVLTCQALPTTATVTVEYESM